MKFLAEISDKDFGIITKKDENKLYKIRRCARAVVINDNNKVYAQYVGKYDCHCLAGGRIEGNETIEQGLKREVLEEIGCDVEILKELGITIEYRDSDNALEIDFGFIVKKISEQQELNLTQEEIEEENSVRIIDSIQECINIMSNESCDYYKAKFWNKRNLIFLKEALKVIDK